MGINLDELRKELASEATKENKRLKKENARLRKQFADLSKNDAADMRLLENDCQALSERCFALTQGMVCAFCDLEKYHCKHTLLPIQKKYIQEAYENPNDLIKR